MRTVGLMLAGGFLTLAIVGGFLALDRTVLHVYYNDTAVVPTSPTSIGLTATEAEIYAVRHLRDQIAETDSNVRVGATCDAKERISAGWLVQCDLTNLESGRKISQALAYVVNDHGRVSDFR